VIVAGNGDRLSEKIVLEQNVGSGTAVRRERQRTPAGKRNTWRWKDCLVDM